MAKRSPILGYNHNVRFRGIVFHVQTEDSGLLNPHVFSHLFHGGVILSTRKLVYDPDATEEVVKALMQSQHKAVLRDLRKGTFDDKIDVYLAGTPGLLPREAAAEAAEAANVEPAPVGPPARVTIVTPPAEPASVAELAPSVVELAASVAELAPPSVAEAAVSVVEPAPSAPVTTGQPWVAAGEAPLASTPSEARVTAQLPTVFATFASAQRPPTGPIVAPPVAPPPPPPAIDDSFDDDGSAPSIEFIEGRTRSVELPRVATPRMDLELPKGRGPALELDDGPFAGVTSRSIPPIPLGATERVPMMSFGDGAATGPIESLLPEPDLSEPELLDSDLLELAGDRLEPPLPAPGPVTRTRSTAPPPVPPPMRPTPRWIEPVEAPVAAAPIAVEPPPTAPIRVELPAVPIRAEPSRTGPMSPVRVSFVSARGPTPPLEPAASDPASITSPIAVPIAPITAPLAAPITASLTAPITAPITASLAAPLDAVPLVELVPLDAIVTPPSGIAIFDDLLGAALPPAALSTPGAPLPAASGLAALRPLGPPSGHDNVPRLAGVPAPTPPHAPIAHPPPPIMAVPAPPHPPYLGHASSPTMARPGNATQPRAATPTLDDDDLLAAALTESNDVAEIHAPPLPSVSAPPGAQPERPGEYYVTRTRADAPPPPPPPRGPVTAPRAIPGPTRPQASSHAVRGVPAPPAPLPVARPGISGPAARPPTHVGPPAPAPRPEVAQPAPAPRPAPVAPRPNPRPRPTTGAGVVVSRPAVIVGAPTQPNASPVAPTRPRRARDSSSDGMISERSLDEVILAYLSEDTNDE